MSMPTPARAVIRSGKRPTPAILGLVVLVIVIALAVTTCSHRENANDKLVRQVTEAIQHNDVTPVAKDFNAITRAKLTRASVGRLADKIVPLGKVKSVEETTPKDLAAGRHLFIVHFDKADWNARMSLDLDGKIDVFHLEPQGAAR